MAIRGEYEATGYSTDVKEALGAIGDALRDEGWTVPAVRKLYKKAGYPVGKATLRRWTNAAAADQPIISPSKGTGAKKKVDDETAGCSRVGFGAEKKSRSPALH